MTTSLLLPLHGGPPNWGDGPPPFAPFLGGLMFLLFLLFVAATVFLLRSGRLGGAPPWIGIRHSPEHEARRVLAERFARGDITSDEFMERASVLNWTPGSETWPPRGKKSRR